MSKTTKRVALALVLLCLALGGMGLYLRGTGPSEEARPVAAGQPSPAPAIEPVAPPAPAPTLAPPPAPPAPAPAAAVAVAPAATEPVALHRSHRQKTVALAAEPARAASASPDRAVAAPAEPPAPQVKWGNIAIEVRPRLGDAVQSFAIVKVTASVDGREVSSLDGTSFGQHMGEVEAWNGPLQVGEHVLNVVVEYHGNGHNVFSYFNGYRYTARSSTVFRLDEGTRLAMKVDLLDRGGVNTAFEKRLAIAFAKSP